MRAMLAATFALLISSAAAARLTAQAPEDWAAAERAIRRLPPGQFPQLPLPVRQDLERRHCTIPQTLDGGSPQESRFLKESLK
jgi:hypothetical protein